MKSMVNFRVIVLATAVLFLCATASVAQRPPTTGGYRSANVNDSDVRAAADFAVRDRAEKQMLEIGLERIGKAERQVVAGMNFRLCIQVTIREPSETTEELVWVQAVVYRNLKNEFSLTSWEETECSEE